MKSAAKKLLFSARDPGAAHNIGCVARYFNNKEGYEIFVAAMHPATEIISRQGLSVLPVDVPPVTDPDSDEALVLLSTAQSLLEQIQPDALIVGLSGPDIGLDEALVASAATCPSYALQDFWGDVAWGFGIFPGTYFVLDNEAARLTRNRVDARVVVTGSPRHEVEVSLPELSADVVDVLFCGQPLWGISGYADTISSLASRLCSFDNMSRIVYRPHPKETEAQRNAALHLFAEVGVKASLDTLSDINASLSTARIVATCYSNCGLDLAYLNRASNRPLAGMLYLLICKDVFEYYVDYSKLSSIPLAESGLAQAVYPVGSLADGLRMVGSNAWRRSVWEASRKVLPDPSNAMRVIEEQLVFDLNGEI